jgi:hypothetical protein
MLSTVGIYSLTAEEYNAQELETAQLVRDKNQYIVTIEMFHQLHCLVSLRVLLISSKFERLCTDRSIELSATTTLP